MELEIVAPKLKPAYLQVKEQLEAYISNNNLAPYTMLPNVKTVATTAGVSIRTADKGMKELIKAGICFRRPKKGTFVAERNQPVLRTKTRKVCGVLSNNGLGSFGANMVSAAIYRGMTFEAAKHDIDLVIIAGDTKSAAERIGFYHNSRDLELCGVICIKYSEVAESIELAGMFPKLRFFDVNHYTDGFELTPDNIIGVFNDDFAGAYQAMQAMLEHNYAKIGMISIPLDEENYRNRIKGFIAALDEIDSGPEYRLMRDTNFKVDLEQSGFKMMQQLLAEGFEADVVMCVNDMLAAGASAYLKEINRTNIRVCGYDNILPEVSINNQFTTVSIDFEAMGGKAIKAAAQTESRLTPKMIKISPLLIVRNRKQKKDKLIDENVL